MTKKILIIGNGDAAKSALSIASLKDKYGEDIVLVTPEEAQAQGLKIDDFDNVPTMKITAPVLYKEPTSPLGYNDGKKNRRERREMERKINKNKK